MNKVNKSILEYFISLLNSALDGSLNTVGNTWDAKHLSTFL